MYGATTASKILPATIYFTQPVFFKTKYTRKASKGMANITKAGRVNIIPGTGFVIGGAGRSDHP